MSFALAVLQVLLLCPVLREAQLALEAASAEMMVVTRGRSLIRERSTRSIERGGRTAQALAGGKGPAHERDQESSG